MLDLGAGGAAVRFLSFFSFFLKPCFACQSLHGNPVINRNGADEVETKMRNKGC